jgi:hypothetical protein
MKQIHLPCTDCTCLPPGSIQISTKVHIWWPSLDEYISEGAVWYHQDSATADNTKSGARWSQLRWSVALFWWQTVPLLAKSCVLARGSHWACQPYEHQEQCLPCVSNSKGQTAVTDSSAWHGIPLGNVRHLQQKYGEYQNDKTPTDCQAITIAATISSCSVQSRT